MDGYLIKINSTDITGYLKAPNGYTVNRAKLWKDAGRNMSGDLRSTFLGIYPKISLDFKAGLSATEIATLVALLDNSQFTVEWFDAVAQSYESGTYYAGDFEYSMHRKKGTVIYDSFKCNVIPFSKMT